MGRDTFNQTRLLYLQGCVGDRLDVLGGCTCGAVCAGDGLHLVHSTEQSAGYLLRRERGWGWKPREQPLEHVGRTGHAPAIAQVVPREAQMYCTRQVPEQSHIAATPRSVVTLWHSPALQSLSAQVFCTVCVSAD